MQLPNPALESSAVSTPAFPIALLPPALEVAPDRNNIPELPCALAPPFTLRTASPRRDTFAAE